MVASERCRTDRAQRAAIRRAPDLDQIVGNHSVRRVAGLRDHRVDMLDRCSRTDVDGYLGRTCETFEHGGEPFAIFDGRINDDRCLRRLGGAATEEERAEQRRCSFHAASTMIRSRPADLAA